MSKLISNQRNDIQNHSIILLCIFRLAKNERAGKHQLWVGGRDTGLLTLVGVEMGTGIPKSRLANFRHVGC